MRASDLRGEEKEKFQYPLPPEFFPSWALREAKEWSGIDEFSLLVRAEEKTGKKLEVSYVPLPSDSWGFHLLRGNRAAFFVNSKLPPFWRRFALFHELYHLLEHRGGPDFWERTATPLSSFEHQADLFAWAAVMNEWSTCWQESTVEDIP